MPFVNSRRRITNADTGRNFETGVALPWGSNPAGSYAYYECSVGVMLDSGIVVHNRLPQVNNIPDTLSAVYLETPEFNKVIDRGVNLASKDQYTDIVQRMGHSRYWFRLWGMALRIGHRVPIPGIKTIGGVAAIPYDKNPQWAFNSIVPQGNFGGLPLWRAAWSLWYTTASQPTTQDVPESNLTAHINGKAPLPKGIQAPWSQPDSDAETGGLPRAVQRR